MKAEGNRITETDCYTIGFEGGGRDYKPRNAGVYQQPEEARESILLYSL